MMTALIRIARPEIRAGRRAALSVALLALGLAGCNTSGPETTGSIGDRPATSRQDVEALAERFNANPGDGRAAVAYARALRANDQISQASAVLQQAALRNPKDTFLLGA
jgi:Flp pilus assembly protein TadD